MFLYSQYPIPARRILYYKNLLFAHPLTPRASRPYWLCGERFGLMLGFSIPTFRNGIYEYQYRWRLCWQRKRGVIRLRLDNELFIPVHRVSPLELYRSCNSGAYQLNDIGVRFYRATYKKTG